MLRKAARLSGLSLELRSGKAGCPEPDPCKPGPASMENRLPSDRARGVPRPSASWFSQSSRLAAAAFFSLASASAFSDVQLRRARAAARALGFTRIPAPPIDWPPSDAGWRDAGVTASRDWIFSAAKLIRRGAFSPVWGRTKRIGSPAKPAEHDAAVTSNPIIRTFIKTWSGCLAVERPKAYSIITDLRTTELGQFGPLPVQALTPNAIPFAKTFDVRTPNCPESAA